MKHDSHFVSEKVYKTFECVVIRKRKLKIHASCWSCRNTVIILWQRKFKSLLTMPSTHEQPLQM